MATAGETASFIIQAKDASGNNKTQDYVFEDLDGNLVEVVVESLDGATTVTAPAEYIGDGQYEVSYMPTVSGTYTVSVVMGGTDIYCGLGAAEKCSPFELYVEPGATSYTTTTVSGLGLSDAEAGVPAVFNIHAFDIHGNSQTSDGDQFEVLLVSTDDAAIQYKGVVVDLGDGEYEVTYSIPLKGTYRVSVVFESQELYTTADSYGQSAPAALSDPQYV